MLFGDYVYGHVFKFTGAVPSACYIDFQHAGLTILQKTLVFSVPADGWMLTLTEAETEANEGKRLVGHLVTVVDGIDAPVAEVTLDVQKALTERRP